MANTIKIKNSGNTSAVPSTLEHGELGLNYADGKLFYKNASNTIVQFGGGESAVPVAGLEGQILAKATDTDYDLEWIDNYTGDLRIIVKNDSGVTISKGQAVMAVGAVGDRIEVAKAVADGSVSSKFMLGIASANISDSAEGYIQLLGEVRNLNTSAFSIGTVLYIDPDNPGILTSTVPVTPDLEQAVAIVTRSHASTGIIFVRMWSQGQSVSELHDVSITAPVTGDALTYNGSVWVNAPSMPSGSITQFAGSTAPTGWLSCDGANVSRTTYAALFAIIGTTYGAGDGSTTFNLPNMKGRVPVGYDSTQAEFDGLGETGGEKTHLLIVSEMPSHTHLQNAHNHTQNAHNHTQNAHGHSTDAQGFHAHNVGVTGSGTSSTSHRHEGSATLARGILGGSLLGYNFVTDGQGSHGHNITAATPTNNATTATNNATTATNQNTGGDGAHNNLQPYIVLNYIIKI
jgi:microcystin-dependent protein